jgi:2,3-bisphosphoglycerate-dependent phosphoglycerate mutase
VTSLLLVRHARSLSPVAGGPDEFLRPLTSEGHVQAKELIPELLAHQPTRFVSSPYKRAIDTITPAAEALGRDVELVPDLREWVSGLAPGPGWQDAYRRAWERPELAVGTGESQAELQVRALAALDVLIAQSAADDVVVLGSHGTWISRLLAGAGCTVDADFWLAMPMPAVYVMTSESGTVRGPGLSDGQPRLTH